MASKKKKKAKKTSNKSNKQESSPVDKTVATVEQKQEKQDTKYTRLLLVDDVFSKVDRRIADIFIKKSGSDYMNFAKDAVELMRATAGLRIEAAMAKVLTQKGK